MSSMNEKNKKFYLTTAIPYVNAKPHIGHALEFVQADVIARVHRLRGEEVCLLSGGDENALKNVQAAEQEGAPVQEFIDRNAESFAELARQLDVQFDVFQKGSDRTHHFPSSQELWRRCAAAGDIYKKSYEGLYCVGCETFYAVDELNGSGECFEHPGKKLELVAEENYFFRLSRYQNELIKLIETDALAIMPRHRKNEVTSFLKQPLQDISISRTNARAKNWGVPVPGDDTQRIYVWFDALNIYQSGVGFGWDEERYQKWWPADAHLIGKGILRFHAVYWPAFLLSAQLPVPKALYVHGYITIDGQKMSKTLGNGIDPFGLIEKYGADPVRYYLLREIPSGEDGDFSIKKFEERYNGDLANGLGNLVARVATLGEKISPISLNDVYPKEQPRTKVIDEAYEKRVAEFRLNEALELIWGLISLGDKNINDGKPWAVSDEAELRRIIGDACHLISTVSRLVAPFIPETARKINEQISVGEMEIIIKRGANIFPRLR
ncbi:MAG: methionine--tRNA ligase [bacterium]|nr:methionine--tRNA ligase [bacterium]MDZ4299676.1 methionine--tRNA ligase [Candidatus Sungbacteria bacterium]